MFDMLFCPEMITRRVVIAQWIDPVGFPAYWIFVSAARCFVLASSASDTLFVIKQPKRQLRGQHIINNNFIYPAPPLVR